MPTPVFLSLDGLDGTGKSTQCRLLVDWLVGQKVPVTACTDPGGTAKTCFVFRRNPGDQSLFNLNWIEFGGAGVSHP